MNRRHYSESVLHHHQADTKGGGNSLLSRQLTLELRLQQDCKDLLNLYKETQDWSAVGQLAQALTTCSSRIEELKRRLKDLETSAPVPFLEKIQEFDNESTDNQVLKPLEGVSNHRPSAELKGEEEKPISPEKTQESLPEASSITVNKLQAITKDSLDCDCQRESDSCVSELPDNSPLQTGGSKQAIPLLEELGLREKTGEADATIPPCQPPLAQHPITQSTENHSDPPPSQEEVEAREPEGVKSTGVSEGVKESDSVSDIEVEDLNQLTDMMEVLVDQFTDLSKQHQEEESLQVEDVTPTASPSNQDAAIPPTVVIHDAESADQVFPKGTTDASSESSEQFFSPRDSLYNGSDVGTENEQFEDARSGSEQDSVASSPQEECKFNSLNGANITVSPVISVNQVGPESGQTTKGLYCVQAKNEESVRTFGQAFSPVFHTYEDFIELSVQLTSQGGGGSIPSLKTELLDTNPPDPNADVSTVFEEFLNLVSSMPDLRETPVLLNFLQRGCGCVGQSTCGMGFVEIT